MCSPAHKGHGGLDVIPAFLRLVTGGLLQSAQPNLMATKGGLRSLRDLTQHLTTRADDSHAAPVNARRRGKLSPGGRRPCQWLVRFCALRRIKPHAPPLVRAPSIPLSFNLAAVLPQAVCLTALAPAPRGKAPTTSTHRLGRGLPGYLILFAPHAFAPQRQNRPESRFRHRCSSQYLRISPLHWIPPPLPVSSLPVSDAVPG